jgi:TolA-binding protein
MARAGQSAQAKSAKAGNALQRRPGDDLPELGKLYFEAESSFANGNYDDAVERFQHVLDHDGNGEYHQKAAFELGRALFEKGDYGATIRHYSGVLKDVPRHPHMAEILYYIGASYGRSGDAGKGKTFLTKARTSAANEPVLRRKIDQAIARLES